MRHGRLLPVAALALAAAACGPRIRPLQPTMENGEILSSQTDEVVQRAAVEGAIERDRLAEERAASATAALASCAGEICAAISRGELAVGMTEAEVLAATRTTAQAWDTRDAAGAMVMTARPGRHAPSDAQSEIAFIAFRNGRVASYTYREPQGMRTVASAADATVQGAASARADALLREGDEYAAAGRLDLALERYDQADVLRADHPETTLRIARTLDKSLRPVEAVLRYRMFIHQMELERIRAEGEVAAKIAEAIARAHERIIILERR